MGKILSGILGGFAGKVGPVVGAKWKSIDYMRSYVVPSNPNTTGQQTVRTKFAKLVSYAKTLLPTLIQTYWDPFYSDMSGFNAWMSANYAGLSGANLMQATNIMAQGSLEPIASLTSAIISASNVQLTFDETAMGNGLATDQIKIVYYSETNDYVAFINPSKTRADSPFNVTPPQLPEENDIIFLFLHRGTGSEFVVSDSKAITVVA